jgi:acetyl esterase/lipase
MDKTAALILTVLLATPPDIREIKDLPYVEGPDADPVKHKLDLFLPPSPLRGWATEDQAPKEAKKFPVLMWIHGGAWAMGDRAWFGEIGRRFAEEGIGLAAISYRLTPKVKHPAHIEDCARAFAWLRANVATYGGDPDRLFVSGQSAGGHLAALLAVDPSWLRALQVPDGSIRGAIPMSGIYSIPVLPAGTKGLMSMFPDAFGSDPEACKAASPITHVGGLVSPMLVITERNDPGFVRMNARTFQTAAEKAGVKSFAAIDAEDRNHFTIVIKLGAKGEDPTRAAMVEFVRKRCRELDASK